MTEINVTCVETLNGRIVGLGGPGSGGWRLSEETAIARIKSGRESFFTMVDGSRAVIEVYRVGHTENLRTRRNGVWVDNLGALPTCPVTYRKIA